MLKKITRNILRPLRSYLFKKLEYEFNSDKDISPLSLKNYINFISQKNQKIDVLAINWLDDQEVNVIKILRSELKITSSLPKYFQQLETFSEEIIIPPIIAYSFNQANININSSSFVYNNSIIIERFPYIDPQCSNYSSGFLLKHNTNKGLISKNISLITIPCGIFLGGNGAWNYYHWIIEILPKLQFLTDLSKEYGHYPLFFSEDVLNIPSFHESLKVFNLPNEFIFLRKSHSYIVDKIIYISTPNQLVFNIKNHITWQASFCFTRSESIQYLKDNLLLIPQTSSMQEEKSDRKLFLARRNNRRSYNQNEVYNILSKVGFIEIYMEDYSFQEQIQLFSKAQYIIGPTGAAWTNLIFCKSTVKCLCWMPEKIYNFSAFSNLAKICNIDLEYISYKVDVEHDALHSAEYTINIQNIHEWLIHKNLITQQ